MGPRLAAAAVAVTLVAAAAETARPGAGATGPAVAMVEPGGEAQEYWPRWRGPSGQGLTVGEGYPDAWSDTGNVVWRAAVPGRGHSSPIVWRDRIVLTTGYDDGRVAVVAYRRSDGRRLWETFAHDTTPGEARPEEQPRLGDALDRRPARVRLSIDR